MMCNVCGVAPTGVSRWQVEAAVRLARATVDVSRKIVGPAIASDPNAPLGDLLRLALAYGVAARCSGQRSGATDCLELCLLDLPAVYQVDWEAVAACPERLFNDAVDELNAMRSTEALSIGAAFHAVGRALLVTHVEDGVPHSLEIWGGKEAWVRMLALNGEGSLWCGWIPAECAFCNRLGMSRVFLTQGAREPVECQVLCPACGAAIPWGLAFAGVASKPIWTAGYRAMESGPAWLNRGVGESVHDACRRLIEGGFSPQGRHPIAGISIAEFMTLVREQQYLMGTLVGEGAVKAQHEAAVIWERLGTGDKSSPEELAGVMFEAASAAMVLVPSGSDLGETRAGHDRLMRTIVLAELLAGGGDFAGVWNLEGPPSFAGGSAVEE